jgi:hypothetical protein
MVELETYDDMQSGLYFVGARVSLNNVILYHMNVGSLPAVNSETGCR